MDKKLIVLIIAVLVAGGAGFVLMVQSKDAPEQHATTAPEVGRTDAPKTETAKLVDEPTSPDEQVVDIKDFAFPEQITVKKGAKVTWINKDSVAHTVTADEGSPAGGPDSESLANGQSYSLTFDTVGNYRYHCKPHPTMTGVVTVIE